MTAYGPQASAPLEGTPSLQGQGAGLPGRRAYFGAAGLGPRLKLEPTKYTMWEDWTHEDKLEYSTMMEDVFMSYTAFFGDERGLKMYKGFAEPLDAVMSSWQPRTQQGEKLMNKI